jgi:hypothetical protein
MIFVGVGPLLVVSVLNYKIHRAVRQDQIAVVVGEIELRENTSIKEKTVMKIFGLHFTEVLRLSHSPVYR